MPMKAILVLFAALVAGCSLFTSSGPTAVARGEYYAAGRPEYDAFFIRLHQFQVDLLAAPEEPRGVRAELTRSLGLTSDASDESLGERLGQELRKLADRGLRVRLEVPQASEASDASATLYTSETKLESPLRLQLPQAATRLLRSRNRMRLAQAELERLRVTGIQLEGGIDAAFRTDGPWKRDEVRRNLADGQKLITLMSARAKEVEHDAQELLQLLASRASTDPDLGKTPAFTPPPAPEAEPARGRPKKRAPLRSSSRPRPAAPPPARPQPRPAPAVPRAEAEPPRAKPTQGNAPAEIEP